MFFSTLFSRINLPWVIALIGGSSIFSKYIGGWLSDKALKFSGQESRLMGVATMPQLLMTLIVVFMGAKLGILPEELVTAMAFLSLITVFISPIVLRMLAWRLTYVEYF